MNRMMNEILPTQDIPLMCQFSHVTKAFVSKELTSEVLHDVCFTVPTGSFTILHGPSGSGKTTILNTMIAIEPPTSGTVKIDGVDVYGLSADDRAHFRSRTLGMVYQDNYWVNSLSVIENIALPLLLSGWSRSKAMWVARQSIIRVGLEQYADYNPTVLSGGQQQRISFARATVIRPKLLVADEPTGNLDSKSGELIIKLLQDFNNSYGATVVLVTHNTEFIPVATNLITIKDGYVTQGAQEKRLLKKTASRDKVNAV